MKIKSPKDFWAGLMFIAFGLGFAFVAQNYEMGTAIRMGPGYFPTLLGGLLAVLGLVVLGQSLVVSDPEVPKFKLRPLAIVLVSICFFGFLIRSAGLIPAVLAVIVVSSIAHSEFKWRDAALLAAGLAAFSVVVFHYGLGLPFKLYPGH